ncbi:Glc8 protein [Teratosphaeria destructans]|uniref:Glc8 protein n=1 Tax=Teratosphaeria destructans TaxID=418781 RepID=A0A9W7SLK0_9PEZI|nr:Glc8 protein [Teratosphaeria destructans]
MAQTAPAQHTPPADMLKRPKGILKNSNSYQHTSPDVRISPTQTHAPSSFHEPPSQAQATPERPGMPARELSEKEITQMNTELNAGGPQRRNSSNPRGSISRRQSGQSANADGTSEQDEPANQKLKWDEANLWLNEGQMGGKMKIDEPKTPFVRQTDPVEDDEEIESINAQGIAVDELDMAKSGSGGPTSKKKTAKEDDIPGLDIGEPEMEPTLERQDSEDRRVTVGKPDESLEDGMHHGEDEANMTGEELAKHRKFEQMRKKHYEMKNIKNLLGHPEALDVDEEDEDEAR